MAPKKVTRSKHGARMGRPPNPEGERLVAYGLHISPDKKGKLVEVKDFHGLSIREWIEEQIERAWLDVQARKAEARADKALAKKRKEAAAASA